MANLTQAVAIVTGGIASVAGISTLALIGGSVYLWTTGADPPQEMLALTWALIGAHLGIAIGRTGRSP